LYAEDDVGEAECAEIVTDEYVFVVVGSEFVFADECVEVRVGEERLQFEIFFLDVVLPFEIDTITRSSGTFVYTGYNAGGVGCYDVMPPLE